MPFILRYPLYWAPLSRLSFEVNNALYPWCRA